MKVQAKLILLIQNIRMAELLALQDLLKKLPWTTLKPSGPQDHLVSESEQYPQCDIHCHQNKRGL